MSNSQRAARIFIALKDPPDDNYQEAKGGFIKSLISERSPLVADFDEYNKTTELDKHYFER